MHEKSPNEIPALPIEGMNTATLTPTVSLASPVMVVEKSANRKLVGDGKQGFMSCTYVSQASCPKTCPFYHAGCYAESGPTGFQTAKVNKSTEQNPVTISEQEAVAILTLSGENHLRLHVVGDCTTDEGAAALAKSAAIYSARHGKKVYTYTHGKTARSAWGDISVLASVENMTAAKDAHNRGYAPAMVVSEFKDTKAYDLGDGFKGIPCPAQTGRAKGCVQCGLCMNDKALFKGKKIILFEAHGSSKRKMLPVLNG